MIDLPGNAQVWLGNGPTDMRYGFDGLPLVGAGDTEALRPLESCVRIPRGKRGVLPATLSSSPSITA